MITSLIEKNIVIVGGCGLIGQYFAEFLLELGSNVFIVDSNTEAAKRVEGELKSYGRKIRIYSFDVSRKENWDSLFSDMDPSFEVNGLVYCAALNPKITESTSWPNQLSEINEIEWTQSFQVGVLGIMNSVLACLPAMQRAEGSSVVLLGSDLSYIAPDNSLYCSCLNDAAKFSPHECPTKPIHYSFVKSGLIGLTKNLAAMLASRSVHVNILCPGTIFEESMPVSFVNKVSRRILLGRPGLLSELELPLLFLLNSHKSYMTGQSLIIDGGRTTL